MGQTPMLRYYGLTYAGGMDNTETWGNDRYWHVLRVEDVGAKV